MRRAKQLMRVVLRRAASLTLGCVFKPVIRCIGIQTPSIVEVLRTSLAKGRLLVLATDPMPFLIDENI